MITDYNITDCINDEAYEFYNKRSTNWDNYYDILAEMADREYEDSLEEEN